MKGNGSRYWRAGIVAGLVVALVATVAGGIGWSIRPTGAASRAAARAQSAHKVVDHTTINLFHQLATDDAEMARLRTWLVMYGDKSVGDNIRTGLACLAGTGPTTCGPAMQVLGVADVAGPRFSMVNIRYAMMDEAGCGAWNELVQCFQNEVNAMPGDYAALSWGHSYMEVEQLDVLRFFDDLGATGNVVAYEGYQDDKGVPRWYWTSSLKNGSNDEAAAYNNAMRARAAQTGGVLFDFADLLSYDLNGEVCTSLFGYTPGLCPQLYSDQTVAGGGHLSKLGEVYGAMGLWLALAFLDGWGGAPEFEPTATWTPIPPTISPLETPASTTPGPPTPTPCACEPCPCGVTATATLTPTVVPTSVTVTSMPTATTLPTVTASPTVSPTSTPAPAPTPAPISDAENEARTISAALDLWKRTVELYNLITDYGQTEPVPPQRVSEMATEWWTCAEIYHGGCPR